MKLFEYVTTYGPEYGPWVVILLILLFLIIYLVRTLLDEDKSALWRAQFFKAIYLVSGRRQAEKKFIQNDACSRLNLARRRLPFGKEYLPRAIKIEWFDGAEGISGQLEHSKIYVRLDPADSQERNVVHIAQALVQKTSLVGIRYILTEALEIVMDLNLVKNLLAEIKDDRVLDWFLSHDFQPTITGSTQAMAWNETITAIDQRGFFTLLLLVELTRFARQVMGTPASADLENEVFDLIHFVKELAIMELHGQPPLVFIGRYIKVAMVPAGQTEKLLSKGTNPYIEAVAHDLESGAEVVYISSIDKQYLKEVNPEAYEQVLRQLKELNARLEQEFPLERDFSIPYSFLSRRGRKLKGKLSRYVVISSQE